MNNEHKGNAYRVRVIRGNKAHGDGALDLLVYLERSPAFWNGA